MRVKMKADGSICSAGVQASHMLSAMAAANGLVDVPPLTTLPQGSSVQVWRWD
jgi:molybdopterin biosynthesis enzyme